MSPNTLRTSVRVAILQFGLGTALLFSPEWVAISMRNAVVDAAAPGLLITRTLAEKRNDLARRITGLSKQHLDNAELRTEIHSLSSRINRLTVMNLELQRRINESERQHDTSLVGHQRQPLIIPDLVEAVVLGSESADAWRSGRFINRGSVHGLQELEWVLRDDKPLIDQGQNAGLESGQPVYAGRSIVGRISRVGHWTSTVQPITDPDFRGLARLVHESSGGVHPGAEGILHGTGESLCRLNFVDSEAPVSEGDGVYTGDADGVLPFPMYFGRVEKAELKPGAPHWDIWVRPDINAEELFTVQVLRKVVNPLRKEPP